MLLTSKPKLASKTPASQAGCVASFAPSEVSALLTGHSILLRSVNMSKEVKSFCFYNDRKGFIKEL